MSDRSYCTATIFAVAPNTAGAVRDALLEDGFDAEYAQGHDLDSGGLRLGMHYVVEELVVGESATLARKLHTLGASFDIAQDARYEYTGEVWRATPALGLFSAEGCSYDGGQPLIHSSLLEAAIAATQDRDELVAALNGLTGTAWEQANAAAMLLVEPDPESPPATPYGAALPTCDRCQALTPAQCTC